MAATNPIDVGTRLGAYTILDVLGRGSQGVVYLAQREGREPLALKVLRSDADARARARFAREAKAAASVIHDGVLRVHDSGEVEGGGPIWYAMERVEAGSLERRLAERGALDPRTAAHLVAALARAVAAAHAKGVVHRDLKPANVLLVGGSVYRPKIADFGLALVQGGTKLTQTGAFCGTPLYLPPEVVVGEVAQATADVYALGAILYECLTGAPPFVGPTISKILERVLKERPAPPRAKNPKIPPQLERICLQCLEKSPAHRVASAESLAVALERFLGERPEARGLEAAREKAQASWLGVKRVAPFAVGLALGLEVGWLAGGWALRVLREPDPIPERRR